MRKAWEYRRARTQRPAAARRAMRAALRTVPMHHIERSARPYVASQGQDRVDVGRGRRSRELAGERCEGPQEPRLRARTVPRCAPVNRPDGPRDRAPAAPRRDRRRADPRLQRSPPPPEAPSGGVRPIVLAARREEPISEVGQACRSVAAGLAPPTPGPVEAKDQRRCGPALAKFAIERRPEPMEIVRLIIRRLGLSAGL